MAEILVVSMGWSDRENPVGNFEYDQAVALEKAGHMVNIFALDLRTIFHSKHVFSYDKTLNNIRIKVIPLHIRFLPKRIKYLIGKCYLGLKYKKYIKNLNVDVIHAHWGPYCYLISMIAKQLHIPLVVTEHNSLVNMPNPKSEYFNISTKAYAKADKRLCVSTCLKKNLKISTGLDFEVVPNVLDPLIFNNNFKLRRRDLNDSIELVSVGHLLPIKNFELLIKCIYQIGNKKIKLRIFGEGILKNELQHIINFYNLQNQIILEGNVDRKILVINLLKSDAFVLLSKSETFGVAFIEAMACGLPVFSSKCGGTDDIIISERFGMIAKSFEIEELTKELTSFLENLDQYDREEISEYALKNFSESVLVSNLLKAYNQL
ncbi:glycosyltransferase [Eubacterium sp. MSJ-33]|uniref:glycosyltransferase n=1 Tax=Eubacterium sp. MSJ-33 TaxID=2841528 RepID=UPI001C76235B|nr:glycosyltransferase [Eubacterium sp. MSJ-33]QWT52213.1 glycosyltransferase [Eubacterium sp. MSJ-33]